MKNIFNFMLNNIQELGRLITAFFSNSQSAPPSKFSVSKCVLVEYCFLIFLPCLLVSGAIAGEKAELFNGGGVNKNFGIEKRFEVMFSCPFREAELGLRWSERGAKFGGGFVELSDTNNIQSFFMRLGDEFFREEVCNWASNYCPDNCSTYANKRSGDSLGHLIFGALAGCFLAIPTCLIVAWLPFWFFHRMPLSLLWTNPNGETIRPLNVPRSVSPFPSVLAVHHSVVPLTVSPIKIMFYGIRFGFASMNISNFLESCEFNPFQVFLAGT